MISESFVVIRMICFWTEQTTSYAIAYGRARAKQNQKRKRKGKRKMNKNPNLDPKHQPVYKHAESVRHQVV